MWYFVDVVVVTKTGCLVTYIHKHLPFQSNRIGIVLVFDIFVDTVEFAYKSKYSWHSMSRHTLMCILHCARRYETPNSSTFVQHVFDIYSTYTIPWNWKRKKTTTKTCTVQYLEWWFHPMTQTIIKCCSFHCGRGGGDGVDDEFSIKTPLRKWFNWIFTDKNLKPKKNTKWIFQLTRTKTEIMAKFLLKM